jgi:hypothetical protein
VFVDVALEKFRGKKVELKSIQGNFHEKQQKGDKKYG